ncbi:GlsB/YeaQ/YmgE family stress response membrane protein [Roseobacter sp. YSTF-M11]|uniref:GlsB/YeaQ/YmgE family stress response membrane protein n=1 Tax=Roseobacter insulae TaxID=2859783 RepID=A0A9X1FZ00_9RHOB|nr:GlsB/YeaQ/YmgE family stress response membrane protein [Roseobacter insulae]MBW4709523.1 GlsB/YeaQ/YmgE family stress response membrane protein [Roseobacter insulae]
MTGIGWIGSLIIGALAGWIAEKIMKSDQSLLMNIVLGIVGALVLNWLLIAIIGTTLGGWIGQLIVAAAGACLLIFIGRLIRRKT